MSPAPEITSLATRDMTAKSSENVIRIGVPNADSAIATAHVLQAAIEKFFKNTVELIPASHEEIFSGIAAGDGSFDIHPDVWLPNHRRYLRKSILLNKHPYIAIQGICVPRYVLTDDGVHHLRDLANGRVAQLFDNDHDGKGNIWIGPKGWQSTEINRLKARDYGFAPFFTLDSYPEKALYRRLSNAIGAQQPFVFHCYGPHWMYRKYDLVQLKEPTHNEECFHLSDNETDADWLADSHASCREPTTYIHVAYSQRIVRQFPKIAEFLSAFSFHYEDLNDLIFRMIGNRRHKAWVARRWVNSHSPTLRKFLAGNR